KPLAQKSDAKILPACGRESNDRRKQMLRKHGLRLLALFLVAASVTSAYAQRGRMVYLGNAHVDGSTDHDSIKVGHNDGTFRAILLRIRGGAVNFERVIVRYGNGTAEE